MHHQFQLKYHQKLCSNFWQIFAQASFLYLCSNFWDFSHLYLKYLHIWILVMPQQNIIDISRYSAKKPTEIIKQESFWRYLAKLVMLVRNSNDAEVWNWSTGMLERKSVRNSSRGLVRFSVRNSSRGQGPLNFWVEVREEFLEESESESECECESERGRELRSLLRNYLIHPIYTCWSKCRCHTTGTNRLRNRNVATGMQQECNRRCAGGHPV